jgi:hypothetical protein
MRNSGGVVRLFYRGEGECIMQTKPLRRQGMEFSEWDGFSVTAEALGSVAKKQAAQPKLSRPSSF